jgi:hypothetical protein
MCLVVDASVFSSVFRPDCCNHADFAPVLHWITVGPGFLVYGGTTYKDELRNARRYLALFIELKKRGKAKEINRGLVDQHEQLVKNLVGHDKCDDFHIIAIFRVSGCALFCSNDARADCYIKDRRLYKKGQHPPSIYRNKSHRGLLNPRNIVQIRNCCL